MPANFSSADALLAALVAALFAGCLWVWVWGARRVRAAVPLLPLEPRRSVPWRGPEVAAVAGLFLALIAVALHAEFAEQRAASSAAAPRDDGQSTPDEPFDPDDAARQLAADATFRGVLFAALVAFLVAVRGAGSRDLGLSWQRAGGDLWIGAGAFLAALGPVYAVQLVLLALFPRAAEKHPILQLLTEGEHWQVTALAVVAAVVLAPVFEEFVFRAFVQGWLEKRFGNASEECDLPAQPPEVEATPSEALPPSAQGCPAAAPSPRPRAALPVVLSSALFAAVHASVWPSPIPLFVLGLILGYVYWRTHRLLPCIVAHALFNGASLTVVTLAGR